MNGFELQLFSGSANTELAERIAKELKTSLGKAEIVRFANSEIKTKINENVRGKDVFLIQSVSNPVNENLMEMLIFIDSLKRASAQRITAVIPWFAYARQDKKFEGREPITAKLVSNLITVAGANRVLALDLHSPTIQGFFDIPVDNLTAFPILIDWVNRNGFKDLVVVAPDDGAMKKATNVSKKLNAGIAFINKSRPKENVAEVHHVIGNVKEKNCFIFDDMVDTAGTIVVAAEALKRNGAKNVFVLATHGPLSGKAVERIEKSKISKVVLTDSISLKNKKCKKVEVVSVAPLLAKAIKRIHESKSVSELFE